MKKSPFPITDDHIHIHPGTGRGLEAAKDFQKSGGTHIFLVSLPSWSYGIVPGKGEDYRPVFEATLKTAAAIRELGLTVYPVLGIHPAEITYFSELRTEEEMAAIMQAGLDLAARYVTDGSAVALKSGRPHYPVGPGCWDLSNAVLAHALELGGACGCAVQIHAETGPCADVVQMAETAGMDPGRVVKHFATPDTPLAPSFLARDEIIPALCREKRAFTMESDYMDDPARPGAVIGPRSVPRITTRLLAGGAITEEDVHRIHAETPSRVYGVEIAL